MPRDAATKESTTPFTPNLREVGHNFEDSGSTQSLGHSATWCSISLDDSAYFTERTLMNNFLTPRR